MVYDPGNVNGYTESCKCTRGGSIYIDEAITSLMNENLNIKKERKTDWGPSLSLLEL